ncbi:MAG: transglutaminase family protein [Rhodocyclaceae bacterium]|nr:transglutaminase family protein [Rhodocyclaceae bacterium]MCP5231561.1 transglutaminase family protein [Zoogloeaceae bacterium]MCP5254776.1 transglutaminase family protein [Zoogloeaceae bacterium]MCP5294408.1 transglutaminase family protein [Zoogloeaceae bacterium]MCW5613504.1 transglutaminase family protein [Rhodocyclaceae bacterium]
MSELRYHIRHDTRYEYDQPVGESRQMLRLTPRDLPWQRCLSHRLVVEPQPTRSNDFVDDFGNRVRTLHLQSDHDALIIRAESWVALEPRNWPALEDSLNWERVRSALAYQAGRHFPPDLLDANRFLFESRHVRVKREFADYADECFPEGVPILIGAKHLMNRIFDEFTFDPEATTVSTPVTEVFEKRRGVCQDFAHFMLSCLRSIGLAARYMSGYLLTRPPEGKPRLIGADATHAWIAVYCPESGWVDFDPTNNVMPDLQHITLGWGRDFADISPLRGVLLGGGSHDPEIEVTVVPEGEFDEVYAEVEDAPSWLPGLAPTADEH